MFLWLCVAVRVVANPCSNALQKWLVSRGFPAPVLLAATHAGLSVLILPALVGNRITGSPAFWWWSLAAAALAVAANWLIIEAVHRSDLSLLGPINSYKPVVSLVPSLVLLGEWPEGMALSGIGLVLAGSLLLVDQPQTPGRGFQGLVRDRGVQLRFAALLLSAAEAVALKRALHLSDPFLTFAAWVLLGLGFSLPFALRPAAQAWRALAPRVRRSGGGGMALLILTTGLMQYCTLVTLQNMPVGVALALFQLSTLFSVVLGHAVFREPHFRRRMLGAGIMALGAAVLVQR